MILCFKRIGTDEFGITWRCNFPPDHRGECQNISGPAAELELERIHAS